MSDNNSISIIGSGNVANQLATTFHREGITVSHIYSRNKKTAEALANKVDAISISDLSDLPKQLCIVCVSDDSVAQVIEGIDSEISIAYTSGSVELSGIEARDNIGVFYPLQTFTKESEVDFFEIPIFIESNNDYFTSVLFDLAWKISRIVNHANSEERKKMHVAAVMVNNFTNHILHLAQKYSEENDINFDHLKPLLSETVKKLNANSAFSSQTGPARRGDDNIIQQHINGLTGTSKEVYKVITKSIIETYRTND